MAKGFDFESKITWVAKQLNKEANKHLLEAVMIWHDEIVSGQLVGERMGREYRIPSGKKKNKTGRYRASRPGEAPASRTGRLRSSYRFRVVNTHNGLVGEVGSPLNYALYLEKGTKRMAPRPHVKPAYFAREQEIKKALGKEWF